MPLERAAVHLRADAGYPWPAAEGYQRLVESHPDRVRPRRRRRQKQLDAVERGSPTELCDRVDMLLWCESCTQGVDWRLCRLTLCHGLLGPDQGPVGVVGRALAHAEVRREWQHGDGIGRLLPVVHAVDPDTKTPRQIRSPRPVHLLQSAALVRSLPIAALSRRHSRPWSQCWYGPRRREIAPR